jgi:hypothetical protein
MDRLLCSSAWPSSLLDADGCVRAHVCVGMRVDAVKTSAICACMCGV